MPVISGPSGKVTEANMAIAMAQMGGLGIIHRNQSIESQAAMVKKVKQYETGFILQCETLRPNSTVRDALALQAERGCSGIPITDNGKMGGRLVGIVTKRDLESVDDTSAPLRAIMSENVVTVMEPVAIKAARETMAHAKVSKLPIVNEDNELVAMMCRGDVRREFENSGATKDANRSLVVAAAVGDNEEDAWSRVEALVEAGTDLFFLDTSDGVLPDSIHLVKRLKDTHEDIDVIAGRVHSIRQAKMLCDAGVDGVCVGGAGAATATALYKVASFVKTTYALPVMADCASADIGQAFKAICLGASTVVVDPMLNGTEEAPGDHTYLDGVRLKLRHGPPGADCPRVLSSAGVIVNQGSAKHVVPRLVQGVALGLRELGIRSLADIHGHKAMAPCDWKDGGLAGKICQRTSCGWKNWLLQHCIAPGELQKRSTD
eukprot:CAMPEP_0172845348 /NCGR_PEP_ID=MMETSP1075-20121228/32833_1 /TAXON_ID=2916 /ORGANISM="Ceratium fusus, Strain PA161109" /LENGTH=432 /DNA_ID=CAMNT_0013689937 /DNA_START=47 /DNA_END=1343 /DNA_ORIENTATION=+